MANDEDEVGKALRAKSMAEFAERTKGKPTPTQEENDRAALGQNVVGAEHEADGANVDEAANIPSGKELREKSAAQFAERMKGKPTPTQDENDRVALGERISALEPDGSNPDEHRAMEAKPGGTYETRQTRSRVTRVPSSSES